MSKAEEIHYKAVMAADNQEPPKDYAISAHADHFKGFVEGYIAGYRQAEKDNELTWEDIEIIVNAFLDYKIELIKCGDTKKHTNKEYCVEILNRFNKQKGK